MTERSVLNILLQNDLNLSANHTDDFNPLLIPEVATKVSSALSSHLNNVLNNPVNHRDLKDTLSFIHNLCARDEEHCNVDEGNRSMFLEFASNAFERDKMQENCYREIKAAVDQFHSRTKHSSGRKHEYNAVSESILKDLRSLEKTSRLEFNTPPQHEIPCFQKNKDKNDSIKNNDINEETIHPSKNDECRLKHIEFGYAILNIGNEDEIKKHITILLDQLSKYKELNSYEKCFCNYLFKFIDQKSYLLEYYSDKLFFVIEILIIDMCTVLVKATEEDFKSHIKTYCCSQEFQTLALACKSSESIYLKIQNMFYTLYCFSRFNIRILIFLNHFNSIINSSESL